MHTKLSFRKKKFTSNQTRPLLTIPKISSSHTQRFVREHAIDNLFQSVPASLVDAAKSQLSAQLNRGRPPSFGFGSFCYQVVHQHLSCPWLEVIPLKYQEMGGGGKRAGSISWSRVMADATLPLPPVQDSYSSRVHGWRGRHTSLSTNMGSIFQQPSNFLIKPVRPCLNLTCKRHCTKTRIRKHITCVDQTD